MTDGTWQMLCSAKGVTALPALDMRAVQLFVLIAEGLTFREAAALVHLEPPHATKLMKALERALGTTLLRRNSRHIELTPAGKAALEHATQLLDVAARLAAVVASA